MIDTAIILAAGFGKRLKEKTKNKPKGFLELNGISLIERSINNLLCFGIKNIYIGTGYLSQIYNQFSQNYTQIKCIYNQHYNTTGSMYTLSNMQEYIHSNFLLLESDLIYEKKALEEVLNHKQKNIILASGKTNSGDEVYIEADNYSNLINLSKDQNNLKSVFGELVGISKISYEKYLYMNKCFEQENKNIDYEYIMVKAAPFYIYKMESLIWCEIDDNNHLERAQSFVLPQIEKKENCK